MDWADVGRTLGVGSGTAGVYDSGPGVAVSSGMQSGGQDSVAARKAWLYPLRDLMGFIFWVRSYLATRRLRYRGDPYELLPEGAAAQN